jgi:hypothetical protein
MIAKAYERISNALLKNQPVRKAKRYGLNSLHKTKHARKWRMFWRLKSQRIVGVNTYWKTK